jgi:hypothetical protein
MDYDAVASHADLNGQIRRYTGALVEAHGVGLSPREECSVRAGRGVHCRCRGDAAKQGKWSDDLGDAVCAVHGFYLPLNYPGVCHGYTLHHQAPLHHPKLTKALPK